MTIKLILLNTKDEIISTIQEGVIDNKVVCYLLTKPCKVTINGSYNYIDDEKGNTTKYSTTLQPWPILSQDDEVELSPSSVIAVVTPNNELKEMYETEVLGVTNEIN